MDIKHTLLNAAHIYYDYLCEHNLGLSEISIKHYQCANDELIIAFKSSVGDMDLKLSATLLLNIGDQFYSIAEEGEFKLAFYDEERKMLHIKLEDTSKALIVKSIKKSLPLRLFSDLKFLVQNVIDFFENYGDEVALCDGIAQKQIAFIDTLSQEQNQALFSVLNHPLSYVWGPPGTGKTQAVLFQALLYYIKEGKRVAIIASTNNALEQVLKTLIAQFDTLGLERSMILRLGMPTLQYINAYPQTCDPSLFKQNKQTDLFSFQDTLKTRLKDALVVGVTLDGFIKRYESLELSFAHIFLDECAYAPLIKACALCVDNTPLAFFGDHKQLSPVCEMPLEEMNQEGNHNAFIWNLSSLFLESFCKGEKPYKLAALAQNSSDMPPLDDMIVSKLSQTHRYGDNLAKILDKYIYHIGLRGLDSHMELLVYDSGAKREQEKHISESEALMCKRLCEHLARDDYAVITPFVKQRKRLMQYLGRDRVFTIHGSQGQEFDNVILSPVSLHYHLTDSRQLHALYALNVAISRAKKRLFIVCDYAFWSKQTDQLLWAILQESKLIGTSRSQNEKYAY